MPFPPNFTNSWDITFPPDTQLANLLGQDLRNLRVDVMQRLSLLSGTLGNRPTPEIVNATWGGAGFGLLYFATDTSQIFQWNGATWVDLTNTFKYLKFTDSSVVTVLANVTGNGNQIIIPANNLIIGSHIKCSCWGDVGVGTGTPLVRLQTSGSTAANILASTQPPNGNTFTMQFNALIVAGPNISGAGFGVSSTASIPGANEASIAINLASGTTITSFVSASANCSVNFRGMVIEVF